MFDCTNAGKVSLVLILLLISAEQQAPANLVTNGDFSVNANGWTASGGAGWASTGGNPSGHVLLNSIGQNTADPTIRQTISLSPGPYTLSWDYALHVNFSGANGKSFGVFLDTQADPNLLDITKSLFISETLSGTSSSPSYVTESVSFNIPSLDSYTFFFSGELDDRTNGGAGSTDVSYRLDNVSLVPEPSAFACIGLAGGLGLCILRRVRGRDDRKPRRAADPARVAD